MNEEKHLKGTKLALDLLEKGEIPLDKKGKPSIKDIMAKTGLARSTAFHVRKQFMRIQKAKEGAFPSEVTVEEIRKEKEKPRPPSKELPEAEVEEEKPLTYEEVLKDLADFEDMLSDGLVFAFGKQGLVTTSLNDEDYAKSEASCKRLARNVIRYVKRQIDPETLEGYALYILLLDAGLFLGSIPVTWFRKRRKKEKKE